MKSYKTTFVCTVASCVVSAGTAIAAAEPAPPTETVSYQMALIDTSVVTTLDHGTFDRVDSSNRIAVRNAIGQVLETLPLDASLDGQTLPLRPALSSDGRTLTVTPDASGIDRNALKPIASPLENQLAMNDLINAVSIGSSLGSLVGTAIGAVVGTGIGLVLAGTSCVAISLACVVAVLPIMALTAGVGGIAGLVLAGGPVAVGAAFEYLSTLNAPDGSSKYADRTRGKVGGPAAADPTQ